MTHRERKKQQLQQSIIKSSQVLFAKKGYRETSIADITKKANCAPRTFFQYFTSKEELLLIGIDELWNDLSQALATRQSDQPTLQIVRDWMQDITKEFLEGKSFIPNIDENTSGYLSMKARQHVYSMTKLKEILIPELAKDLHQRPTDIEPILIATTAAAMFDTVHTDENIAHTDKLIFIDKAFALLKGAMQSVQRSN